MRANGTFLGNVFSGGQSTTGGSADRLNTLENVLIQTPTPGLWTITIRSYTVPDGPQPFAVVATGDLMACSGVGNAAAVVGSEIFTPTGGDGDASLDNCEGASLGFTVANTGSSAASNVNIVSVSSPSHPGTIFTPPTWSAPSIAACNVDDTAFVEIALATGLSHDDTLLIEVEITNDEIFPSTNTTTMAIAATETDLSLIPVLTFGFEAGYEGWSVQSGTFVRDDAHSAAGGSWYLQSSANQVNQCDVVESPEMILTAASTLSVSTYYDIENGPPWWDRANISVLDGAGTTVVEPDGGRPYDVPDGSTNGTCGTADEAGWAGTNASWVTSTFSASALGSAGLAGLPISFDVRYGTDGAVEGDGFAFDLFQLTNVLQTGPDVQSDTCYLEMPLFSDGFETGDTGAWSGP